MNAYCFRLIAAAVVVMSLLAPGILTAEQQGPPPTGIISWWPGDGNAQDVVGSNDGVLQNGASYTAGKFGQAFRFDGIDDLVSATTTNLPTGKSNRTLELWARIDRAVAFESFFAGYGSFGSFQQSYHVGGSTGGVFPFFSQWGTGCGGPDPMKPGAWYHVAVTNNGDFATLYVNGVQACSIEVPINTASGSTFCMGRVLGALGEDRRLNGAVDEVRIYNRALSPVEIRGIYEGGGSTGLSFVDVSQTSGIGNFSSGVAGAQWVDFNNDNFPDLFLVGTAGSALYKNLKNGKFTDVSSQAGIPNRDRAAVGASWADIDNDGRPDVFIAHASGPPTLLLNKQSGFKDISSSLPGASSSGTTRAGVWMDINNDRQIDLFVINEGASNQLLKQTGTAHFTDIATRAGIASRGPGRSAVSADFNNDGFLDIYLANFRQANKLYINNGDETFNEAGNQAGVALNIASAQATVLEINGDQKIDLVVVNASGPSILFENLGGLKFRKKSSPALAKPKMNRGASPGDFDLDGDEDLVLQSSTGGVLLLNDGSGNFQAATGVDLKSPNQSSGIAAGDFDKNGTQDLVIGQYLIKNNTSLGNNYLSLILKGNHSNRSAIGASVLLQNGSSFQAKVVNAGNGNSQGAMPVHFGVGAITEVDSVLIRWPGGSSQVFQKVKVNKTLIVTEK